MGKKDKLGVNRLFERVENLVGDALKRIDTLQNQVHDLREQVMERAGFTEKSTTKSAKTSGSAGPESGGSKTSAPRGKASAASQTKGADKGKSTNSGSTGKTSAKSGTTGKAATGKSGSKDDLTQIKGVGPATAEKMQAKGITSISQIANPSADDRKKLEEFKNRKTFSSWQTEAKKLI
mgnify:CR=1 FL=1